MKIFKSKKNTEYGLLKFNILYRYNINCLRILRSKNQRITHVTRIHILNTHTYVENTKYFGKDQQKDESKNYT